MSPPSLERRRFSRGRVTKPKIDKTERSGGRTPSEDRERAFIAASRRSDRSAEARLESAHKASEVHFQRTGRRLKITSQIVENGEQYESDEDDVSKRMKINRARGPGPAMGIPTAMGPTLTNDEEFRRREEEINSKFAETFPMYRRQSAPAPYAASFGLAARSHSGDGSTTYSSPLQVFAAVSPQSSALPQGRNMRGSEETKLLSTPPSAYPSAPLDASYMAFGSSLPQATAHCQPLRSRSVDTTTTYDHTPDWILDSSASPDSRGSPFESLSPRVDGQTEQTMSPIFGAGGVLRDRSPFDQGDPNPLHNQPLFPSSSSAPGIPKEQQQLDFVMDDQGLYTQYSFSDQSFYPEASFAQEAQTQPNDFAELILLDQAAFNQATQLNQLDAQQASMSSPHIDLLAEFTNEVRA